MHKEDIIFAIYIITGDGIQRFSETISKTNEPQMIFFAM